MYSPPCWQGRSVRDGTLRRVQRRSFTPASFLEEDTVDFPDELDTSFFARVRAQSMTTPNTSLPMRPTLTPCVCSGRCPS